MTKKSSENDQLTGHFQSFFIYFFVPPTLNLKKNSPKSTNKKILALISQIWYASCAAFAYLTKGISARATWSLASRDLAWSLKICRTKVYLRIEYTHTYLTLSIMNIYAKLRSLWMII